ncbi:MAG: cupin domain-containing protein [Bacteroidales bacterium]
MSSIIIERLSNDEITKRGIKNWPIWTKEVSEFDWFYDTEEECLILEGEVEVSSTEGVYTIKAGDFVTFKQGLKCAWKVTKPIHKHYNFL